MTYPHYSQQLPHLTTASMIEVDRLPIENAAQRLHHSGAAVHIAIASSSTLYLQESANSNF